MSKRKVKKSNRGLPATTGKAQRPGEIYPVDPIVHNPPHVTRAEAETLALVGLCLIQAEVDTDEYLGQLIRPAHVADQAVVIDTLLRVNAALLRALCGWDSRRMRQQIDVLREVIITGKGLT